LALFGIKPHHISGEKPAAKVQMDSSQIAPSPQTAQPTPALELHQQKLPPSATIETFPYKACGSLLKPSELAFYRALGAVVGNRALVCPKVRLGDVFYVIDFKENLPHYFNIAKKHVDFLLCNPQTIKPIVGIELDDEGHEQRDRKERDRFVKKVFEAAGLPLEHIPVQSKYDAVLLTKRLAPYLDDKVDQPKARTSQP
jgi:hypothetical protein